LLFEREDFIIQNLVEMLEKAERKIIELERTYELQESVRLELEQRIRQSNDVISRHEQQIEQFKERSRTLRQELSPEQSPVSSSSHSESSVSRPITDIQRLHEEIRHLNEDIKEYRAQIHQLIKEKEALQAVNKETADLAEQIDPLFKEMTQKYQELQEENSQNEVLLARKDLEIERLNNIIKEMQPPFIDISGQQTPPSAPITVLELSSPEEAEEEFIRVEDLPSSPFPTISEFELPSPAPEPPTPISPIRIASPPPQRVDVIEEYEQTRGEEEDVFVTSPPSEEVPYSVIYSDIGTALYEDFESKKTILLNELHSDIAMRRSRNFDFILSRETQPPVPRSVYDTSDQDLRFRLNLARRIEHMKTAYREGKKHERMMVATMKAQLDLIKTH